MPSLKWKRRALESWLISDGGDDSGLAGDTLHCKVIIGRTKKAHSEE